MTVRSLVQYGVYLLGTTDKRLEQASTLERHIQTSTVKLQKKVIDLPSGQAPRIRSSPYVERR
jgi:hypothetical protein